MFSNTDYKRVSGGVALCLLVGLFVVAPGAVAEPATVSSSGPTSVEPGETVTVSVTVTNTGSGEDNYIADLSAPDGWAVSSHTDDGGTWNSGDLSWLWQNVAADSTVTPAVTLTVPTGESSGSYTVETTVKSNDGIEDTTTHTVTVEDPDGSEDDGGQTDDGTTDGGSQTDGGTTDGGSQTDGTDGEPSAEPVEDGETERTDQPANETSSEADEAEETDTAAETGSVRTQIEIQDTDPQQEGITVDTSQTESVDRLRFDDEAVSGTVEITEYRTPPEGVTEAITTAVVADSLSAAEATPAASDTETDSSSQSSATSERPPSVSVLSVTDISPSSQETAETAATVTLSVDRDRLTEPANAQIRHQTDDGWEQLETTYETTDGEVILEAETESFSLFAVVETTAQPETESEPETQTDDQDPETTTDDATTPPTLPAVGVLALIVLGVIGWKRR